MINRLISDNTVSMVSKNLTFEKYVVIEQEQKRTKPKDPSPILYVIIFTLWLSLVIWFQPRLIMLMDMAYNWQSTICLGMFVLFINFAWLYGIYNLGIVLFSFVYKLLPKKEHIRTNLLEFPKVAILYTTCNDFVEESVTSCVKQDYPNYMVYILDDSSDDFYKNKIDQFASENSQFVKVVRRENRIAYKAGNMNNALEKVCFEKYFAVADADEILPIDFLSKLVPEMEADPSCGFVQANHRANPNAESQLAKDMGVGIDLHWKWYQPFRNDYGFVMFLGHGALLRRKTWEEIGGFPNLVSEDLGFAIHAREAGYRGKFVEDVVCYEDFPDTVRTFRIRHMKWTRGTSEFLHQKFRWLLKAKNITLQEKLDILFPTLNLPLTMFYFLFMINANIVMPYYLGYWTKLTFELGGHSLHFPILTFHQGFNAIYDFDFYLMTMVTFFSPVLCFIIGLINKPIKLFNFLSKSTALYASLSPLSTMGVLAYMITGKAIFLVTGGNQSESEKTNDKTFRSKWSTFLSKSHPDTGIVQGFEIGTAIVFGIACVLMFQISFFGLCFSFALLPLLHRIGWEHKVSKVLMHVPFILMLLGILFSSLSMAGIQSTFFGYGIHF